MDRHGLAAKERTLTPFYQEGALFSCDYRDYAYHGITDVYTRALLWKLLLKVYPEEPSRWSETSSRNQRIYSDFVHEFIVLPNERCGHPSCDRVPNPLDVSWKQADPSSDTLPTNESQWSRDFGDSLLRDIIWKDTERTHRSLPFFVRNRETMARILFVYAKLNKGVEYVQGMNELLAPLLLVFARGEEKKKDVEEPVATAVEADVFFAFMTLLAETRDLFVKQVDGATSGLFDWRSRFTVARAAWRSWTRFSRSIFRK